jgi:hypothetical protein
VSVVNPSLAVLLRALLAAQPPRPVMPPLRVVPRQQPLPYGLGLFHGWGTAVAPGAGLNSENWNPVQGLQNYRIQTRPPSNL